MRLIHQNLPNLLTAFRLAAVPVMIVLFLIPGWGPAATATLFSLACLSDILDGHLARRYGLISKFGEFIDPIADKMVVITALLLLLSQSELPDSVSRLALALAGLVIIMCDMIVTFLRVWLAQSGQEEVAKVSLLGKTKTVLHMVALAFLLAASGIPLAGLANFAGLVGIGLLLAGSVVSVFSTINYFLAAFSQGRL